MKLTVLQNVDGFSADVVLSRNGEPLDLTGASCVLFKARAATGVTTSRVCTVLDPVAGLVRLVLTTADTKLVGAFRAVFEAQWPGTKVTVPNTTYINYQVIEGV